MLIGLVLLIAFSFASFYLKDINLHEEEALFDEAVIISESIPDIYYTPLSYQERIDLLEDSLEKLTAAQNRISKTILAKLVVDYSEIIDQFQNELSEQCQNDDKDYVNKISFLTQEEHSIISDQEFTKESLLNLAAIIDETFPGVQGNALFILNCEYGYVTLVIIPYENSEIFQKIDLEKLARRLSLGVFNKDSVYIRIDFQDLDNEQEESVNG